jgi:tetratricopeptide (TPR) repeat protein
MKEKIGFWRSLEKYGGRVAGKNPLPWPYLGLGLVALVLVLSRVGGKDSTAGAKNNWEIIEKAANVGDYQTAQALFEKYQIFEEKSQVLGAETELEARVYPERQVEKRIQELKEKLQDYPEYPDILLEIARLYRAIGNEEAAQEYWEQARILDPNNLIFQP